MMKKKSRMKRDVSIIVPLYKGSRYCDRLMKMFEMNCRYKGLYQKCSIEVIFINDYPEEKIILEAPEGIFHLQIYTHEKNQGIHAARVSGVKLAAGAYVIMLDQDDLVKDNWLYSQWNAVQETQTDVCLCNGWGERFRILKENDEFERIIEHRHDIICTENPIMSPGQAIIKKDCIPKEWTDHIMKVNGADDFLLWIMMTKRGCRFTLNKEYLYYHSPERTEHSVHMASMIESLKEVLSILSETGNFLSGEELTDFQKLIEFKEKDKGFRVYLRDMAILHSLKRWLKIKNQGIELTRFFHKYNYRHIAVYGMGHLGESLYYELRNSDVCIDYAIDRIVSLADFEGELDILSWEDPFRTIDAVVVTLVTDYSETIKRLRERLECPVILMEDILREVESDVFF